VRSRPAAPRPAAISRRRLLAEPDLDAATIRDELAVALALGGHQTTVALAWALALIGAHPDEGAGRSDDIVDEALRLYPPFHLLVRHTAAPLALREGAIPAGTTVLVSPHLVQRDPRWFPRPDDFVPGRWRASARGPAPTCRSGRGPAPASRSR
jgi:cytochrome P450